MIDNSVEQVANTGLKRKSVHAIGAETAGERVVVRVRRLRDRMKYTEYGRLGSDVVCARCNNLSLERASLGCAFDIMSTLRIAKAAERLDHRTPVCSRETR